MTTSAKNKIQIAVAILIVFSGFIFAYYWNLSQKIKEIQSQEISSLLITQDGPEFVHNRVYVLNKFSNLLLLWSKDSGAQYEWIGQHSAGCLPPESDSQWVDVVSLELLRSTTYPETNANSLRRDSQLIISTSKIDETTIVWNLNCI